MNTGLCADCNKEQELKPNGHCLVCDSSSTMKRGAITELDINIKIKQDKAKQLLIALRTATQGVMCELDSDRIEMADKFVKALKEYENV